MCDITKDECTILQKRFESLLENQKGKIYVSASLGWARFSNKMDSTYESVFNRADEEMYDQKVRMKEHGKTSKVVE
jgi:GGDEF domain-containing protein